MKAVKNNQYIPLPGDWVKLVPWTKFYQVLSNNGKSIKFCEAPTVEYDLNNYLNWVWGSKNQR